MPLWGFLYVLLLRVCWIFGVCNIMLHTPKIMAMEKLCMGGVWKNYGKIMAMSLAIVS